jgi:hypothetical protein
VIFLKKVTQRIEPDTQSSNHGAKMGGFLEALAFTLLIGGQFLAVIMVSKGSPFWAKIEEDSIDVGGRARRNWNIGASQSPGPAGTAASGQERQNSQ